MQVSCQSVKMADITGNRQWYFQKWQSFESRFESRFEHRFCHWRLVQFDTINNWCSWGLSKTRGRTPDVVRGRNVHVNIRLVIYSFDFQSPLTWPRVGICYTLSFICAIPPQRYVVLLVVYIISVDSALVFKWSFY